MTRYKILLTTLLVGSAMSAAATAAPDAERGKKMFEELDTDKNGVITHAEMMAKTKAKFDAFDKNGDGFLELDELPKVMPVPEELQKRMEKRKEKLVERAKKKGRDVKAEEIAEIPTSPTRLKFVARHDRDGDEKVSLEEFSERAVHRFKRGDLNGDGALSMAEVKDAMKHHRKDRFKGKGERRDWR